MAKAKETASEAEAGEDGAVEGKKKPPLMVLIAAGVGALVVLGGGGAGAMMMLNSGAKSAHHKPAHKAAKAAKGGKDAVSPISEGPDGVLFYTMPDMVVNIQSTDGRPTYLKLKLAFELPDQDAADAIEPNAPRLNDMFQSFLRELRPDDLAGSQGSFALRQEIQRRVDLVIAPSKVNAVLIQEMLIQ